MPFAKILTGLILSATLTGCGYVHFGRAPNRDPSRGDAAMATAYSQLATDHKILKQELALVRKEGDAIRAALDHAGGNPASRGGAEVQRQLAETTQELMSLRARYTQLQTEGSTAKSAVEAAALSQAQTELQEKLARSLRSYTELKDENIRLSTEVTQTRAENDRLAAQLKVALVNAEAAKSDLAQLNTEFVAEKEARRRAEQATGAVRAQLTTIMAQAPPAAPQNPPALQIAKTPPENAGATAELRVVTDQLHTTGAPAISAKTPRRHLVKSGDSLEKIARNYYGSAERWRAVYDANQALLKDGQALRIGMELILPEN